MLIAFREWTTTGGLPATDPYRAGLAVGGIEGKKARPSSVGVTVGIGFGHKTRRAGGGGGFLQLVQVAAQVLVDGDTDFLIFERLFADGGQRQFGGGIEQHAFYPWRRCASSTGFSPMPVLSMQQRKTR